MQQLHGFQIWYFTVGKCYHVTILKYVFKKISIINRKQILFYLNLFILIGG